MARLVEKDSRAESSRGGGTIPDFPKLTVGLSRLDGAQEYGAQVARWNDLMKRRWVLLDEDLTKRFEIEAGFSNEIATLTARIATEESVRANADLALATSITTITADYIAADAALSAAIVSEATARATADSVLASSITSLTATVNGVSADVTTLQTAMANVNGYLEARWTVQVTAGPIVTGMTLYSASGPDTDVSYIAFQADRFQINTASGGNKEIFSATATEIKLGNVLTVDLANTKIYIGAGTFNNASTYFYVDTSGGGRMSLGTQFVWDGTTLSVNRISATTGTIGGWTIGSTTISANNAILDSAGQLLLGTSNDVVYVSATDSTYRLWIGNVTAGSASFRVTKAGVMTAIGGVFSNGGSTGDYVLIDGSGLRVGSNPSVGTFHVNNNSGNPYLNFRYNGNVYGSWSITSTHSAAQWSDNTGSNTVIVDGRGSVTIFGPAANNGLTVTNDALILGALVVSGAFSPASISTGNIASTGTLTFSGDTNLFRDSANVLRTNDSLVIDGSLTVVNIAASGTLTFGGDTNLYRLSSSVLRTDDDLSVAGNITSGSTISAISFVASGAVAGATAVFNAGVFTGGVGVDSLSVASTSVFTGVIAAPSGTVGTPGIHFTSDNDTGIRWQSADDFRFVTGGADRMVVRSGAIVLLVPLKYETNAQSITSETLTHFVTAQDLSGGTIKLAVLT